MEDCIFCKILKGEIPSKVVYEDEVVKVIMDINPVTNGHVMIIPKEHYRDIEEIDEDILLHIMQVAKKMIARIKETLGAEGVTLVQNNGLGQEIKHFHLHLVPRYTGDGLVFDGDKSKLKSLDEVYQALI